MDNVNVRFITSEDEFLALERPWNELLSASGNTNIFLTFEWLSIWWKHFKSSHQLCVAVAEKNKRIVAIAPLVTEKIQCALTLKFMGRPGSDYSDFIVHPSETQSAGQILDALEKKHGCDIVSLGGVAEDSLIFPLLVKWCKKRPLLSKCHLLYVCPYIKIEGTWEEYQRTLKESMIKNNARQKRRLMEIGKLHFTQCEEKEKIKKIIGWLIEEKRKRYNAKNIRCSVAGERWPDFYTDISEKFLEEGWLRLSVLLLDEKEIAVCLDFLYNRTCFSYLQSFSSEFARFSPGTVQMFYLVEQAHKAGYAKYDFLAGDEHSKYQWTQLETKVYRFIIYRRSIRRIVSLFWGGVWRRFAKR